MYQVKRRVTPHWMMKLWRYLTLYLDQKTYLTLCQLYRWDDAVRPGPNFIELISTKTSLVQDKYAYQPLPNNLLVWFLFTHMCDSLNPDLKIKFLNEVSIIQNFQFLKSLSLFRWTDVHSLQRFPDLEIKFLNIMSCLYFRISSFLKAFHCWNGLMFILYRGLVDILRPNRLPLLLHKDIFHMDTYLLNWLLFLAGYFANMSWSEAPEGWGLLSDYQANNRGTRPW